MIGIMSAMYEELEAVLELLSNPKSRVIGNRTFYTGTLHHQEVVLVFSKWGKVSAAITTTQLIASFKPTEIIFTGVAGAIHKNLNIGDVVYGTRFVQHDMDASPLFPKFEIPLLGQSFFSSSQNPKLSSSVQNFIHTYHEHIEPQEANHFDINTPKLYEGLIASGDEFIDDQTKQQTLAKEFPELMCVEMEGAAVAQVCHEFQVPFNIIRIISDKANQEAPIDFPLFTHKIASKYAKGILWNYCL